MKQQGIYNMKIRLKKSTKTPTGSFKTITAYNITMLRSIQLIAEHNDNIEKLSLGNYLHVK